MEPRFRGCKVVRVRSFARIHETNLKKQGVLPLTFADRAAYDQIQEGDRISVLGLAELAPGRPVRVVATHADGTSIEFAANHTMSAEHIEWFKGGSALNIVRQKLEQQFRKAVRPQVSTVGEARTECEEVARDLRHRVSQMLVAQTQHRHVRAL